MKITIYTKPDCVQCEQTKRYLDRKCVRYSWIDVSVDETARQYVISLGIFQMPVVETPTDRWSGFRYDKLKSLIAQVHSK